MDLKNHSAADHRWLLQTPTRKHWERLGTHKAAGVVLPLFSLYSKDSLGIGEFPDLELLGTWCREVNIRIIQLLPLNDVGFDFAPYAAQSTLALDPMYLALGKLRGLNVGAWKDELDRLAMKYPTGRRWLDYGVKKGKLEILWDIFHSRGWEQETAFAEYRRQNHFWLPNYTLFKTLKEQLQEQSWFSWPEAFRNRDPQALAAFGTQHRDRILFHAWLQWQACEQLSEAKARLEKNGVRLMGDLPFLVSRDSADVWSHQDYFKLELSAGAPPDMFFAKGQCWGMPPYNWDVIAHHGYDAIIEKLRYAERFYDLFRIDHFVGIFRIWTIPLSEPAESGGLKGAFDPPEESSWENHGKNLLDVILSHTRMLPCAEDLGTVPDCSYKTIREYGIAGTDVQRWMRDWHGDYDFKRPEEYRANGMAVISTHDLSNLRAWWEYEAGTLDEVLFRRKCQEHGLDADRLVPQLFNIKKSNYGRLRWREEIANLDVLLSLLGKRAEDVQTFVNFFRETRFERKKFLDYLELEKEPRDFRAFARRAIEKANASASIFSIQMLPDWLSMGGFYDTVDAREFRINFPGTIAEKNWSLVLPFALEELLRHPANPLIKAVNEKTNRK